jgi:hypothetical protein
MAVSSAGLRPKSDCSGKAQKQLYSKLHSRPLLREGVTKVHTRNCLQEISSRKKNWSQVPDGRLTPGQTGRLTVGRKLTATATGVHCTFANVRYPGDESKVIMVRDLSVEHDQKKKKIQERNGKEEEELRTFFCISQSFLPVLSYKLQK